MTLWTTTTLFWSQEWSLCTGFDCMHFTKIEEENMHPLPHPQYLRQFDIRREIWNRYLNCLSADCRVGELSCRRIVVYVYSADCLSADCRSADCRLTVIVSADCRTTIFKVFLSFSGHLERWTPREKWTRNFWPKLALIYNCKLFALQFRYEKIWINNMPWKKINFFHCQCF